MLISKLWLKRCHQYFWNVVLWRCCIVLLVLIFFMNMQSDQPQAAFDMPRINKSNAGFIKLSWKFDRPFSKISEVRFELQGAADEQFQTAKTIYQGTDRATCISGLSNGNYYYRVRAHDVNGAAVGEWSESVTVQVVHHSLQLALWLFALGSLVFLMTVAVVVIGVRRTTNQESLLN